MFFVRAHKANATRADVTAHAIDRQFDAALSNQPHLRVLMVVRRVR